MMTCLICKILFDKKFNLTVIIIIKMLSSWCIEEMVIFLFSLGVNNI